MELKEVQLGMRDGVIKEYGTSYTLHDLPVSVGAKTGSAQTNNNTRTNAFFVGYAPFENPEIAILILIENAKEGSLNAVPIAKDIFNWYYYNRLQAGADSAAKNGDTM
jgi:penicillin-binding protein 2